MAYNSQKIKFGNEPVYVVEIELGFCSNDFGVSPCTATGAAGTECFNCFEHCQDVPNFDETNPSAGTTTKIYRFASTRLDGIQGEDAATYVHDESPTFPTLGAVKLAPAVLTPGKGLGVRATCSVSISDHPWTDIGIDPYYDTRTYDPDTQGTFWGKLLSRNPFYENRKITVKTGFLADDGTYDSTNFISRLYFIDSIAGPDKNGKVTIKGKDVLRFTDKSKAQLPTQSDATITNDILAADASILINDPSDDVIDYYNLSPSQPYIRIDDEVMQITGYTGSNPDYSLTVNRATLPSFYPGPMTAEDHDEGATVQHCYLFEEERIDDVVEYLLKTVAGIDSAYIPKADWVTKIDYGLQSYDMSTLITEPTGVGELLTELTEQTILLWWDERDQEIKMDSLLVTAVGETIYSDDEHIVADSVKVARDDSARISQVWVALGVRNPVLDLKEAKNFSSVKITADLELEGVNAYNQKKVRRIFTRWLPTSEGNVAAEISARLNNFYKTTKRMISFEMNAKDSDVWTGSLIQISTRQLQDEFGDNKTLSFRVLSANEILMPGKTTYKYVVQDFGELERVGLVSPTTYTTAYGSASDAAKNQYFFVAPDSGDFAAGGAPYKVL